jgi:hypothetical protein
MTSHNSRFFRAVVVFDAVLVMDVLTWLQAAAEDLLHHEHVLKDRPDDFAVHILTSPQVTLMQIPTAGTLGGDLHIRRARVSCQPEPLVMKLAHALGFARTLTSNDGTWRRRGTPGPVDLFVRVSMPAPALIMILAPSPCCGFSVARRFNADFRILHPERFRLAGISVRLPAFPVHIAPATSTLRPIAAVDGACADSLGHAGLLSSGPAVSWAVTAVQDLSRLDSTGRL